MVRSSPMRPGGPRAPGKGGIGICQLLGLGFVIAYLGVNIYGYQPTVFSRGIAQLSGSSSQATNSQQQYTNKASMGSTNQQASHSDGTFPIHSKQSAVLASSTTSTTTNNKSAAGGTRQAINTTSPRPRPPPINPPPIPLAPPPPLGPCKIFIIDPDTELAASMGLPRCNVDHVWPFEGQNPGESVLAGTPHWAAPHAAGYWVAETIRRSPHHSEDIKQADLYYLDTHCYESWYAANWHQSRTAGAPPFNPINHVALMTSRLFVDGVYQMRQWTRTAGRRYIIPRLTAGGPPGAMLDTCAKLKRSFIVASERGIFCDNDRNRASNGDSLVVPTVVPLVLPEDGAAEADVKNVTRKTLLYYSAVCPDKTATEQRVFDPHASTSDLQTPGAAKLSAMIQELGNGAINDVDVSCSDALPKASETYAKMGASVFCAVVPSPYNQASPDLSVAALAGCLPVFFGPPYHAMPLAGDVLYRDIAIFFNVTESGKAPRPPEGQPQPPPPEGRLEPNAMVDRAVVSVPTFAAAVDYLRALPPTRVRSMQTALRTEQLKLAMRPANDDGKQWDAGRIVVRRMCEFATRLNAMLEARDAERAASNQTADLPKLPQKSSAGR